VLFLDTCGSTVPAVMPLSHSARFLRLRLTLNVKLVLRLGRVLYRSRQRRRQWQILCQNAGASEPPYPAIWSPTFLTSCVCASLVLQRKIRGLYPKSRADQHMLRQLQKPVSDHGYCSGSKHPKSLLGFGKRLIAKLFDYHHCFHGSHTKNYIFNVYIIQLFQYPHRSVSPPLTPFSSRSAVVTFVLVTQHPLVHLAPSPLML